MKRSQSRVCSLLLCISMFSGCASWRANNQEVGMLVGMGIVQVATLPLVPIIWAKDKLSPEKEQSDTDDQGLNKITAEKQVAPQYMPSPSR